ncbi:MAG: phosphoenolpyruvate carboxykinase, partial [Candidatus Omnitrophota bacterium]
MKLLREKCGQENYRKLEKLANDELMKFAVKYAELFNPDSIFVRTDSREDAEYIRKKTLENKEEQPLAIAGHTAHFDGYFDQGRDKGSTKYLLGPDEVLGSDIMSLDREKGIEEIRELFKNAMKGKEMYVCFYCLGPINSKFSISAVQITDSSYVAHSEDILYRSGYEQFLNLKGSC